MNAKGRDRLPKLIEERICQEITPKDARYREYFDKISGKNFLVEEHATNIEGRGPGWDAAEVWAPVDSSNLWDLTIDALIRYLRKRVV
jgi:hypothetical protein